MESGICSATFKLLNAKDSLLAATCRGAVILSSVSLTTHCEERTEHTLDRHCKHWWFGCVTVCLGVCIYYVLLVCGSVLLWGLYAHLKGVEIHLADWMFELIFYNML